MARLLAHWTLALWRLCVVKKQEGSRGDDEAMRQRWMGCLLSGRKDERVKRKWGTREANCGARPFPPLGSAMCLAVITWITAAEEIISGLPSPGSWRECSQTGIIVLKKVGHVLVFLEMLSCSSLSSRSGYDWIVKCLYCLEIFHQPQNVKRRFWHFII